MRKQYHRWGVIATACAGTEHLEIAYCPLCNQYSVYGNLMSQKKYGAKAKFGIKATKKVALMLARRCTCPEFRGYYIPNGR